jgi:hypothetical protein
VIPAGVLLVVYALCVHRVTRLVTTDTITAGARERLRRAAYHGKFTANGYAVSNRFLAWVFDLVTCDWCTSIWVAAGCALGWKFAGSWFNLVAAALAASSVASLLRERVG